MSQRSEACKSIALMTVQACLAKHLRHLLEAQPELPEEADVIPTLLDEVEDVVETALIEAIEKLNIEITFRGVK